MSITIIVTLVFCALFACVVTFAICQHKLNKELKEKLEYKTEMYNGLSKEFEAYRNAEIYRYKKEEEVNEKIDNLHTGKLSADDILPKR